MLELIRRYIINFLIILALCFYSLSSYAFLQEMLDFFDDVAECVTDPCDCANTSKYRTETWNGVSKTYKRNLNCPPWDREKGRPLGVTQKSCLLKKDLPDAGIGFYKNICAEESPSNTYFSPNIRMRGQQCNAFACWTTSTTLTWEGGCVTLAGGYGFPLIRACARISLPANPDRGLPAEPGYTPGKHLNSEGAEVDDDLVTLSDGSQIRIEMPKLCLYEDPSFLSVDSSGVQADVMDLDPIKQSMHKTSATHPVIEVIMFVVDGLSTFVTSVFDLLGNVFDSINTADDGVNKFGDVMKDLFEFLSWIFDKLGDVVISFLREVGQINRAVDSTKYGCVNIKIGPMPPPYCESIPDYSSVPHVQEICHIDNTTTDPNKVGLPIDSINGQECVVSSVRNNFINNTVRLSFSRVVPLCRNGENPNQTDECVNIKNIGSNTAQTLHNVTARTDIISKCSSSSGASLCIETNIAEPQCQAPAGSTNISCRDGFRVLYGIRMGASFLYNDTYIDGLPTCTSPTSNGCQDIWGVDYGTYVDVSLKFDEVESGPNNQTPLQQSFSVSGADGTTKNFIAMIHRMPTFQYNRNIEPTEMCIVEGSSIVGCVDRAPHNLMSIHDCANHTIPGISCTSTYFIPQFIASYASEYKTSPTTSATDRTSVVVIPKSIHGDTLPNASNVINLAGIEFSSFVTDDTYQRKPFLTDNAPNFTSLFGKYKISPELLALHTNLLNSDKTLNASTVTGMTDAQRDKLEEALYIGGLEYANDKYHVGGTKACLIPSHHSKCPVDPKLCVLTNLQNKDVVNCSEFFDKVKQYGLLPRCTSAITGCSSTPVDSIAKKAGGVVNIKSCASNKKCYDHTSDLCIITNDPADRHDPLASLGEILTENQYFGVSVTGTTCSSSSPSSCQNSSSLNYDENLYALRDKTPVELGLCVNIPQGTCSAVNSTYASGTQDNGYAAWPQASSGQKSTGTCNTGWTAQADPMERMCIPFSETKTFGFEPLYTLYNGVKTYNNMKCEEDPVNPNADIIASIRADIAALEAENDNLTALNNSGTLNIFQIWSNNLTIQANEVTLTRLRFELSLFE